MFVIDGRNKEVYSLYLIVDTSFDRHKQLEIPVYYMYFFECYLRVSNVYFLAIFMENTQYSQ